MNQRSIYDSMHPETGLSMRVAQTCNMLRRAWRTENERHRDNPQVRKKMDLIAGIGSYFTSKFIEGLVRELQLEIGTPGDEVRRLISLLEKINQRGFIVNAAPTRLEEIKEETVAVWQELLTVR